MNENKENNNDVEQEVVAPVNEEVQEVINNAVEESKDVNENIDRESDQAHNFKELRNSLKKQKRENQYLRQRMEELAHAIEKPKNRYDSSDDDELITKKDFKAQMSAIENYLNSQKQQQISSALKAKFPDFDQVVSVENVEYLQENEPELARSLQSLKDDPYALGVAAYKLLKRSDVYQDRQVLSDKKRATDNLKKPASQSTIARSPISEANKFAQGLTPELKKQLYEEMRSAARGL